MPSVSPSIVSTFAAMRAPTNDLGISASQDHILWGGAVNANVERPRLAKGVSPILDNGVDQWKSA